MAWVLLAAVPATHAIVTFWIFRNGWETFVISASLGCAVTVFMGLKGWI